MAVNQEKGSHIVMINRVCAVNALDNCILEAQFCSGDTKQYDVKQLFSVNPQFKVFEREEKLFYDVKVDVGGYGISWNDKLDLDAETIWSGGILIESKRKVNLNQLLAYKVLLARHETGITQKELSERTGIYQADISKIERGIGNPSIGTLQRLADAMEMDLEIDFIKKK